MTVPLKIQQESFHIKDTEMLKKWVVELISKMRLFCVACNSIHTAGQFMLHKAKRYSG